MSENMYPNQVFKLGDCRERDYGRGYDLDPCAMIGALTSQEIRHDVGQAANNILMSQGEGFCSTQKAIGDAHCGLQDKIGNSEARLSNQNADNFGKLMLHTANLERDLQNIVHDQGRHLTTLIGDKTDKILEKVDRENDQLNRDLQNHRIETIREFGNQKLQLCETENRLSRQMEECCCTVRELIKDNELSRLKDELQDAKLKAAFSNACCNGNGNGNGAR